MKRLFTGALALILSIAASATTLNPVQLLNPAGSTSGQAIVSTGASSAPAWGGVGVNGIAAIAANTVLANAISSSASPTAFAMPSCSTSTSALQYTSGTGFTCLTTVANLTGATFTGALSTSYNSASFTLNDAGGTGFPVFFFNKAGTNVWALTNASSSGTLTLNRYVSGSLTDSPISVSNSTGAVTMSDGITGSPISGSTGSFTTLAASGLISPTSTIGIKGATTNDNAQAGSVGEYVSSTVLVGSAVALTSATPANVTSISLTAGDWDVWGTVATNPAGTTTQQVVQGSINTVSATFPTAPGGGAWALLPYTTTAAGQPVVAPVGVVRESLSATTTIYLVCQATFGVSTDGCYGFLGARRVR